MAFETIVNPFHVMVLWRVE